MNGLPILDFNLVNAVKKLMDNIRNDIDAGNSMDEIADMVYDNQLNKKDAYKPLLRSVCDLLREKGYPTTADFFAKRWGI